METWGIAGEVPETEAQTRKRLEAIARDLQTDADHSSARSAWKARRAAGITSP